MAHNANLQAAMAASAANEQARQNRLERNVMTRSRLSQILQDEKRTQALKYRSAREASRTAFTTIQQLMVPNEPSLRELVLKFTELEDIANSIGRKYIKMPEEVALQTRAVAVAGQIQERLMDEDIPYGQKSSPELLEAAEEVLVEGRVIQRDRRLDNLPQLKAMHEDLLEQEEAQQVWNKARRNNTNERVSKARAGLAGRQAAQVARNKWSRSAAGRKEVANLRVAAARAHMGQSATAPAPAPAPAAPAPAPAAPAPLTPENLARRAEAAKRAATMKARFAKPATNGAVTMPPNGASKPNNKKNNTKGGSKKRRTSKTQRNKKAYV